MPHVALVVTDPAKAREAEAMTYQRGGFTRQAAAVRQRPPRPAGSLWAHMSTECPDGQPNCRNCGDPAFAETCKAAGHCSACGTRHGIAPDSVVQASGVAFVEIPPPVRGDVWDVTTRAFVKPAVPVEPS